MASLTEIDRALDEFFGVRAAGPDPGFSRFIPATYDPIHFDWRNTFEPGFTTLFNGLMLRGVEDVSTVFCSVFPAAEVLEEFLEAARPGDLFFTHHPLFIETGDPRGEPGRGFLPIAPDRIEAMRDKALSFYSCHAPLDVHPEVGTTAAMVDALGGRRMDGFWPYGAGYAGVICAVEPLARHELITRLREIFDLPYVDVDGGHPAAIRRLAVVAGAGYKVEPMREAEAGGAQAYVTGEIHDRIADDYGRGLLAQTKVFAAETAMALIGVSHAASEHLVMATQMPEWLTARFKIERIWNSATKHAQQKDFDKVRAKDPGHIIEMDQEIKNLDRLIEEIRELLATGELSVDQERALEKALEAAIQLRDQYKAAVKAAKASSP